MKKLLIIMCFVLFLVPFISAITWNRPLIVEPNLNVNHSETSNSSDFWDNLDDPTDFGECGAGNFILGFFANGSAKCSADVGAGGASKWSIGSSWIFPNSSFSINVLIPGWIQSNNWTNVSINEDQIIDLSHTTDTNFSICNDGEYGDGDGNCYSFNDSVLALTASKTYNASTIFLEQGVLDSGDINSIQSVGDGDTYNISEVGGVNSLRVNITFCDVEDIDFIAIHYWYDANGHTLPIGLWDFNEDEFEYEYGSMPSTPTFHWYTHSVLDAGTHINESGCAILQIDHDGTGISSHDLFLDAVYLQEGSQLSTVNSLFQLNDRDDPTALEWAWDKNGSKIATAPWDLGNQNITNISWIFPEKINWNNNLVNDTVFNFVDFILDIDIPWLIDLIDNWLTGKTTDDLTEGSTNKYNNQSWNETKSLELHYTKGEVYNATETYTQAEVDNNFSNIEHSVNGTNINVTTVETKNATITDTLCFNLDCSSKMFETDSGSIKILVG